MGFWKSFFSACMGPREFNTLIGNSWGRVVWHCFLVCFFCSLMIGAGSYWLVKFRWRAMNNDFNEKFGSRLIFSEKGIIPEKSPEISRRLELPYNSLLIYVSPNGPEADYPAGMLDGRNLIVLWTPSSLSFFAYRDLQWYIMRYLPDGSIDSGYAPVSLSEMREILMDIARQPGSDDWNFPEEYRNGIGTSRLFSFLRFSYAAGTGAGFFIVDLLMVLGMTLFFTVIFKIFSRSRTLTFNILWKASLYAAFPVLFVVSIFPALRLPGESFYHDLFLIGWVGHLFFILRYLIVLQQDEVNKENNTNE